MTIIEPRDKAHWLELKTKVISSTEVPALFNISPYITLFELYHRKKSGSVVEIEETERMRWGSRLESAIANGIAEDKGWKVVPKKHFIMNEDARIGSSFDFEIIEPFRGLLEIKNVDSLMFKEGWKFDDDGDLEAPLHIELQVQHEMLVSGIDQTFIGALVGGNRVELIERHADAEIMDAIRQKVREFWLSVDNGVEPSPDFVRDAEFIAELYQYADPGKVIDVADDDEFCMWAQEYKRLGEDIKMCEAARDGFKARMLTRMGDAEKVVGGGFTISAGVVGEAEISYKRRAYRTFKTHWPRQKGI